MRYPPTNDPRLAEPVTERWYWQPEPRLRRFGTWLMEPSETVSAILGGLVVGLLVAVIALMLWRTL